MNKDENVNNFSEMVDNTLPEGKAYDVFSDNTAVDSIKAENMNRDYLKYIYKEDMSSLNKDVRMTRMQYLREIDELDAYYKLEKKNYKKQFVFITVVLIIFLGVGIWALREWYLLWQFYKALYSAVGHGKISMSPPEMKGYLMMTTFYGTIGMASALTGICQFVFFGYGYHKKIKHLEIYKKRSLDSLEIRKKEAMLLGQYDSLK